MNITNVTITRTAEEKTENAFYMLEYSVVNDELSRLHVSVNEKEVDEEGNIKACRNYLYGTRDPFLQLSDGEGAWSHIPGFRQDATGYSRKNQS